MFTSKWGEKIAQILNSYADPEGAIQALEILMKTAQDEGRRNTRDELAQSACEGLHTDPPAGLKCRKCYDAERGMIEEEAVLAEKEANWAREKSKEE
jgi:hypothetical protein